MDKLLSRAFKHVKIVTFILLVTSTVNMVSQDYLLWFVFAILGIGLFAFYWLVWLINYTVKKLIKNRNRN